ncbi:MAG: hypothetical protein IJB46_01975 [Prevotella sp.]|nr:hypothetical protein [Prevotella sp.]
MNIIEFAKIIFKSQPPSSITVMKAERNKAFCRKGYMAIMLFGRLFTRDNNVAEELNRGGVLMHHEMIHVRQAQAVFDSWLCYYMLYVYFSIRAACYFRHLRKSFYFLNPFEIEAYMYMSKRNYVSDSTRKAVRWKVIARMSLKERYELVKRCGLVR